MTVTLAPALERRLRAAVAGEVAFDRFTRGRYATDASHFKDGVGRAAVHVARVLAASIAPH